ncbi:MAG: tetratricopeptide repeat protein [Spirochaetota bacterium]
MSRLQPGRRSFSKSFIVRYTLLCAALLSGVLTLCSVTLHFTFGTIQKALLLNASGLTAETARNLRLSAEGADSVDEVEVDSPDILFCRIFEQASDERYLLPVRTVKGAPLDTEDTGYRHPSDDTLFLRAYTETVIDPETYSDGAQYWQCVYFPVHINERRYVVQAAVSTVRTQYQISALAGRISAVIRALLLVSMLSFLLLFLLSVHFFKGIQLFFARLARHASEVVSGTADSRIREDDEDFRVLAESFNILTEELKDKDRRISELETGTMDDLFKQGVAFLKERNHVKAEHIFSTLTYIKPSSYGSFFNLGVIYAKQGLYEKSLASFHEALKRNPDDSLTLSYCEKIQRHLELTDMHEKIS